jgi:Zn-finger nucleic acid-binding protein
MVVMELNDIEIDHCLGCRGIWLDAGELELLLEPDETSSPREAEKIRRDRDDFFAMFKTGAGVTERRRKCPICRGRMEKVVCGRRTGAGGRTPDDVLADAPGVIIDRCVRGHGLWFDDGELHTLAESANSGDTAAPYGRMAGLLRDMFLKNQGGVDG